jgi:hypothetical protein
VRIHQRGASEELQRTIPMETADGPAASGDNTGEPNASAPDDAIQLSSLGGVLSSIQMGANGAATFHRIAQLVQQNKYQVDAFAISRKLIAASLQ